jgi:ELWxxDGT repeat protein
MTAVGSGACGPGSSRTTGDDAAECFASKCDGYGGAEIVSKLTDRHTNPDTYPRAFTGLSDTKTIFFSQDLGELWVTDGTSAGTKLVSDLVPTIVGSNPSPSVLVRDGNAYWAVGSQLWVTDGSPAGTHQVVDFGSTHDVHGVAALGNTLVVAADKQLYASDGTAAGTQMIADLSAFGPFAELGGNLYFSCYAAGQPSELCSTDGTAAGTKRLGGPSGSIHGVAGERIVFSDGSGDASVLFGLYSTDGTPDGVIELVPPNYTNESIDRYSDGVMLGSTMYVTDFDTIYALDGAHASDVTPAGVTSQPTSLTVAGGKLYFAAGHEVWVSDGTAAGSQKLADDFDGPRIVPVGDRVAFVVKTADSYGLYLSDGTRAGTQLAASFDGFDNPYGPRLDEAAAAGDMLVFGADDGTRGNEPWVTDGTQAGTQLLVDATPERTADGRLATDHSSLSSMARCEASGARMGPTRPERRSSSISVRPGPRLRSPGRRCTSPRTTRSTSRTAPPRRRSTCSARLPSSPRSATRSPSRARRSRRRPGSRCARHSNYWPPW